MGDYVWVAVLIGVVGVWAWGVWWAVSWEREAGGQAGVDQRVERINVWVRARILARNQAVEALADDEVEHLVAQIDRMTSAKDDRLRVCADTRPNLRERIVRTAVVRRLCALGIYAEAFEEPIGPRDRQTGKAPQSVGVCVRFDVTP